MGDPGRRPHERRPGEALPFRLDPLRWSPAGGALAATTDAPGIGLDVTGTVRAVLAPDGLLDASVRVVRRMTWGAGWVQGEGQQDFRCALEEPVAILLPDPKGRASMPATDALRPPFAAGITTEGSSTVVDFAQFFAGTEGAVYVVVRREPQRGHGPAEEPSVGAGQANLKTGATMPDKQAARTGATGGRPEPASRRR